MAKITITEGLAEMKTIDKRVEKKREFIMAFLVRQLGLVDPHAKEGGSEKLLTEAVQSIKDLLHRKLTIRMAMNRANDATSLIIEGTILSLAEWLVWRREVAPAIEKLNKGMVDRINTVRNEATRKGYQMVPADTASTQLTDIKVNINEKSLSDMLEKHDKILGELDGLLSLKNATTTIDIAD